MTVQLAKLKPFQGPAWPTPTYRQFTIGFFAMIAGAVALFSAALACLAAVNRLPPPPLAGSVCIDEKLKFLSEHDIRDADLIAVGSSVTWRNLDMSFFLKKGLAKTPVNAAPCYLQMSQTSYYTEFLLSGMREVRTVVTVVAPRDFEECRSAKEQFFSNFNTRMYVFDRLLPFPVYLMNFRPVSFVEDVMHLKRMRTDPNYEYTMMMDRYGSSLLHATSNWLPKPIFDPNCFAALTELEKVVNRAGASLIVAAFPLENEWHAKYDADGFVIRGFEARLRKSLKSPSTRFISGSSLDDYKSLQYADSVHLLLRGAVSYSDLLTDQIVGNR